MFKKNLIVKMSVLAAVAALSLAGCTSGKTETTAAETTAAETSAAAPAVGGGLKSFL